MKNKIKLAITGCMGRMGREIIRSSKKDKAFKLAVLTENKIINKQIEKIKLDVNTINRNLNNFWDNIITKIADKLI